MLWPHRILPTECTPMFSINKQLRKLPSQVGQDLSLLALKGVSLTLPEKQQNWVLRSFIGTTHPLIFFFTTRTTVFFLLPNKNLVSQSSVEVS